MGYSRWIDGPMMRVLSSSTRWPWPSQRSPATALGDHQGADRQAAGDVEERRGAPLVGGRVIGAEADRPVAAVVVDREVAQLSVPAVHDRAADEVGAQHPVAALPRHVVDAVLS